MPIDIWNCQPNLQDILKVFIIADVFARKMESADDLEGFSDYSETNEEGILVKISSKSMLKIKCVFHFQKKCPKCS